MWQTSEDNQKLVPAVSQVILPSDVTLDDCKRSCMSESSVVCAAVNYGSSENSCELLLENNETASVASQSDWKYYIRPQCAGKIYIFQ